VAANPIRSSSCQFDLFELDPSENQLRRRGLPVDLPPQALRILTLLAARPNELITRKEIKGVLWPGQSYGDFDSRLNFAIKKLREALGDDAEQPRYVQTVRNAGYRFIAPVRDAQTSEPSAPMAQSSAPEPAPWRPLSSERLPFGKRGVYLALATLILIASAATVLALRQPGTRIIASKPTGPQLTQAREDEPRITSVTAIVPASRQRIVIRGTAFGLHVPYARTDSPYLAIRNGTAHWAAGRVVPHNWDEVMVDVESWNDTEIVISGFSGDYGKNGWQLNSGDDLEIAVWNPQNGIGPSVFHTKVVAQESHTKVVAENALR
jgi:DNA-binding winged helix-turn-helix (wHTH) protein